jgi:hypothetical protein
MALTMDGLKALLKTEAIRFFVDPDKPEIMLGATGLNGSYQCIISIELDGEFVQFRTIHYLSCPSDHAHLTEVLKVLGAENYNKRLVKFGWDASDGEIVAYLDILLQDNTITQEQFGAMMGSFLSLIDKVYLRLKKTIETGNDPGDIKLDISTMIDALPPEMRELLEELKKKMQSDSDPGETIDAL